MSKQGLQTKGIRQMGHLSRHSTKCKQPGEDCLRLTVAYSVCNAQFQLLPDLSLAFV